MYKDDLVTEFGQEQRRRQHLEDDLQAACCTFMSWALPADALYWAVPNGGKRHTREAQRMTRLGVRAGVPDIHLAYKARLYCLELKAPRGALSEHQQQVITRLATCGVPTMVIRSVEQLEQALRFWGIPLNARLS